LNVTADIEVAKDTAVERVQTFLSQDGAQYINNTDAINKSITDMVVAFEQVEVQFNAVGTVVAEFGTAVDEGTAKSNDAIDMFEEKRATAFRWMLTVLLVLVGSVDGVPKRPCGFGRHFVRRGASNAIVLASFCSKECKQRYCFGNVKGRKAQW
jgi:hypothetical protein